MGSGTLVEVSDRHGLIITNWHVVKDAAGNVIVGFPDGFQTPGYVIKMDRDWDLAAIAIWKPNVQPVLISAQIPGPGDFLTICGYGSDHYLAQTGRFVQYLSPAQGWPADIVEMSAAARHGDSGGPMLNARGELAGVLFGEGGGATSGSHCGRVRMFLASITGPASGNRPSDFVALRTPTQPPGVATPSPAVDPAPINYPTTAAPSPWFAERSTSDSRDIDRRIAVAQAPPTPGLPATASVNGAPPLMNRAPNQLSKPIEEFPPAKSESGEGAATANSRQTNNQQVSWEDIAGHTLGDQIKTVLAGVGVLLLLYHATKKIA